MADSSVVEAVMIREAGPRAKRADIVIGNIDDTYLVIEATKQNLLSGIRYAEREQLERWAAEHRSKHAQAVSTARHVHAIAAERNFPPPRAVATLVVADLPLLQTVGLSALLNSGQDNPPHPVICSIPEFTHLIEWGQQGWSIPQIIRSLQHTGTHESLGLFLSGYPHR